ncbi:MAG TPA: hypothetical protein VIM85_11890 [Pseudomonadales bacterium]
MTRNIEKSIWIAVLIVLAAPIVYVATQPTSKEFWDSVASGLFSTAIALIAGIPSALWIDRAIKRREEKKRLTDEREREIEILELIREELSFSNTHHKRRKGVVGSPPVQPLKSDLWSAFTAAGKLNLIRNHRLLNRIASAYYVINIVKSIEDQAYRASRGVTVTFSNGKTSAQFLMGDARKLDALLSDSIQEAISDIDEELSQDDA